MKKLFSSAVLIALALIAISMPFHAYALVPLQINKNVFQLVGTSTPTPTTTNTPSPTVTNSPTPTITPTVTATVTPTGSLTPTVSVTPSVSPAVTPTPKPAKTAGLTQNEIIFGVLVLVVALILLIQGNWGKIKLWIHNKTS